MYYGEGMILITYVSDTLFFKLCVKAIKMVITALLDYVDAPESGTMRAIKTQPVWVKYQTGHVMTLGGGPLDMVSNRLRQG
jgi:hypothetical protein